MYKIKKYLLLSLALCGILLTVSSCGDDDDDNKSSQDWKEFQIKIYNGFVSNSDYKEVRSRTGNGSVYLKKYTEANSPFKEVTRSVGITPQYGDTVVVRYMGWFYKFDKTPYIFDGTEQGDYYINGVKYTWGKNQENGVTFVLQKGGVIEGWNTALYAMQEGDAVNVVIPSQLGYGTITQQSIPANTTLSFDIKLLRVKPIKR